MGFFDSLFGSSKETKPKKKKAKAAPESQPIATPAAQTDGVPSDILAVISASVGAVMEGESDPAVIAAVAAAIHQARQGGGLAIRIKRQSQTWAQSGRQKVMDSRLV